MHRIFRFILLSALVCTSCVSNSDMPNTMGDVFILTSYNGPRKLFKVNSDCFVFEVECQTPEIVPSFPEDFTQYNWADMYWSPNGKFMLSVDHRITGSKTQYLAELILYNAQTGKIEKLISGYKYISGITWNLSNEWAAMAIKKPDDKDMQIVLVSPDGKLRFPPIKSALVAGYPPHIFNGQIFDDNQRPVQWLSENELLFIREKGEEQIENPDVPPVMSVMHLFKFNMLTDAETEIDLPFRETHYTLSPDSLFAYFTSDQTFKTYNFKTKGIIEIKDFSLLQTANWSPDSKWLVVCGKDSSTYVITPDLKKKQKIMEGCPNFPVWMPDSDHLILFFFSYENNSTIIESHWYVASVSERSVREIIIPGLDLRGKNINGIYVQPIKLSE